MVKIYFNGTWGDFGYTPSSNRYWRGSGTIAGSMFTIGTPSWYPAYGSRVYNSGTLASVPSGGYYWSASSYNDSSYAWYLAFYSTSVNPTYGNSRSWGFPVRCVQE